MTEPEHDLDRQKPASDAGQARMRRQKRQSGQDSKQGRVVHRSAARSGPSARERLVASKVKAESVSVPSLQEKLISKIGSEAQNLLNSSSSGRKSSSPAGSTAHRPRRKADARHSEAKYEATAHAETQRITGNDRSSLPRKNRRTFDARAESAPPVLVRGGMSGMAFGRVASSRLKKQRMPKRRIDVPLRVTGAEVRLPSIPFIQLGWRAVSLVMVVMMLASLILIWKAPVFQVNSVEAQGLKRLTVADLNAVAASFGKSVFTINPDMLDQALHQAFPEFSKISVRIGLPAKVKIIVTERVPVIAWLQDGKETWVDEDGISFPPRGTPEKPLIQVEGYGTPPGLGPETQANQQSLPAVGTSAFPITVPALRLSPELVSAILELGSKMPADTLLVYDSEHGLGWNDPLGWDVFFGVEDQDMEMKLAVYQALVERLQKDGIQPALISVEYLHAPYYRMER